MPETGRSMFIQHGVGSDWFLGKDSEVGDGGGGGEQNNKGRT
jgi:hypothetical protein